jgi:hypothetical protein
MRTLLFLLLIACTSIAQDLIARDSNGLIIELKEKYGGYATDTCTAVMLMNGNFIVVHRDGVAGYFPESFHSIRILARLENRTTLASGAQASLCAKKKPEYADLLELSSGSHN